jgi:multidrug efflux system membrane fusion protein
VPGIEEPRHDEPIGPDHQLAAPPKSGSHWIVWTLLVLAVVAGVYIYMRNHKEAQNSKAGSGAAGGGGGRARMTGPVPVTVATATKGNIGVYLDALGTVTPVYTTEITPQAAGVITAVNYHEGQYVRKGDPLIEIDPRPYEATLTQAEGALERDTNVLAQAQMDLERYKQAWARNGINKQLLDDQDKIVLQDQGTVKNDQGTVDYDKVQLSYCHITSPISGKAGLRLVDPGNVVQAGSTTPLVVVTQMQPITVIFQIPEDDLEQIMPRLRNGALTVDAWDRSETNKLATGKLTTTNNQIDTTTGTLKMRATFENRNDVLFPNQFVNTKLLVNTLNGVTLIPTGAVQHNGQVAFVYLIDNGAAQVRNVKGSVTDNGLIAVQGINPGDIVATSSFEKLQAGSKITVSKQPIATNPSEGNTP